MALMAQPRDLVRFTLAIVRIFTWGNCKEFVLAISHAHTTRQVLLANMPLSPMLEESRGLAEQLLENLKPADDAAVIHRVDDMLRRTNDVRAKVVDDAQATLKGTTHNDVFTSFRATILTRNFLFVALSRQLELAKDSAERPKRELEANQHADRMAALDREKYALARNVGEVDATIESLESELGQLQAELAALEAEEKAEAEIPPTEQQ